MDFYYQGYFAIFLNPTTKEKGVMIVKQKQKNNYFLIMFHFFIKRPKKILFSIIC